jgi:hypothetical protein
MKRALAGWPGTAARAALAAALIAALLCSLSCLSGCGLQTEQANKQLEQANKHQEEAEVILARLKGFPAEWQAIFSGPRSAEQLNKAKELVNARNADVDQLEAAIKAWQQSLMAIQKLNVEDKVKKYVALRLAAVKDYLDYTVEYLRPIIKGYAGLVDQVALDRPASERDKTAADIAALVKESANKLEECQTAAKMADDYFVHNKLGK